MPEQEGYNRTNVFPGSGRSNPSGGYLERPSSSCCWEPFAILSMYPSGVTAATSRREIPDFPELPAEEAEPSASDWKGPLPEEIAKLFTYARTHADRAGLIAASDRDGELLGSFFREGRGGGGGVDFRSYARFCSESKGDLLSGKTLIAEEVRVFIEPGNAYLHGDSDDLAWSSYVATSRGVGEPYIFTRRGIPESTGRLPRSARQVPRGSRWQSVPMGTHPWGASSK